MEGEVGGGAFLRLRLGWLVSAATWAPLSGGWNQSGSKDRGFTGYVPRLWPTAKQMLDEVELVHMTKSGRTEMA